MASEADVQSFLAHHGVIGMRWGVRKDRKAAKQNFFKNLRAVHPIVMERSLAGSMSEDQYKKLGTKDVSYKKGHEFYRMKNRDGEEWHDKIYVTTNQADRTTYKGVVPTWAWGGAYKSKGFNTYETVYNSTRELKSPSEKKRMDAYIEIMRQPVVEVAGGEKITGREYLSRAGLSAGLHGYTDRQIALMYHGQMVATQGRRDEPLTSAYFNNLRKKGYNAIVDDADRGGLGDEPFVIFDRSSLKTKSIRRLTDAEVVEAQKSMSTPALRKALGHE